MRILQYTKRALKSFVALVRHENERVTGACGSLSARLRYLGSGTLGLGALKTSNPGVGGPGTLAKVPWLGPLGYPDDHQSWSGRLRYPGLGTLGSGTLTTSNPGVGGLGTLAEVPWLRYPGLGTLAQVP